MKATPVVEMLRGLESMTTGYWKIERTFNMQKGSKPETQAYNEM
jgi:hypothetical protein